MKIYLAGICGAFMAGLARLGQEMGHIVGGCDVAAWPPMSTQLEQIGIIPDQGWDQVEPEQGLGLHHYRKCVTARQSFG